VGGHSRAPVKIRGIGGRVVSLAVGPTHTCALLGDGSVKCWGQNGQGQLGDGHAGSTRPRPGRVIGLGP
jgi:alpha-tubulin suppressor-like RCC1 family protein